MTQIGLDLGAPAARAALEDVSVVQEPVEQRCDRGVVAEELAPVVLGVGVPEAFPLIGSSITSRRSSDYFPSFGVSPSTCISKCSFLL